MRLILTAGLLLALAACAGLQDQSGEEQAGTAAGAVAGGILGNVAAGENKALWTAVGAAAGAFAGNRIADHLTREDEKELAQATVTTADTGEPRTWRNPQSGHSGRTRVVDADPRAPRGYDGPCREVEQTVTLPDGTVERDTVLACLGPDGWAVV